MLPRFRDGHGVAVRAPRQEVRAQGRNDEQYRETHGRRLCKYQPKLAHTENALRPTLLKRFSSLSANSCSACGSERPSEPEYRCSHLARLLPKRAAGGRACRGEGNRNSRHGRGCVTQRLRCIAMESAFLQDMTSIYFGLLTTDIFAPNCRHGCRRVHKTGGVSPTPSSGCERALRRVSPSSRGCRLRNVTGGCQDGSAADGRRRGAP